jgi:hypothetical protein
MVVLRAVAEAFRAAQDWAARQIIKEKEVKQLGKVVSIALIVLNLFLAITAVLGGISLLAGFNAPDVGALQGSIFEDYTIPGLSLAVIVGGSALWAAVLLIRKNRFALLFSIAAGIIIMFFEFVEVLVIGSPPGASFVLQLFYFGLGTLIAALSIGAGFVDLLAAPAGSISLYSTAGEPDLG